MYNLWKPGPVNGQSLPRRRPRTTWLHLPAAGVLALVLSACGAAPDTTDGAVPNDAHITPFDNSYASVLNLDPALLTAVKRAATDADRDDVPMFINSGWRSKKYQQRLLDEAVKKYGSLEEALHWVSTPEHSHHVTVKAVDIGMTQADDWLLQHSSRYGLCQAYANEIWHFELLTKRDGTCPVPRMNGVG